jgi:hypothetical protein
MSPVPYPDFSNSPPGPPPPQESETVTGNELLQRTIQTLATVVNSQGVLTANFSSLGDLVIEQVTGLRNEVTGLSEQVVSLIKKPIYWLLYLFLAPSAYKK